MPQGLFASREWQTFYNLMNSSVLTAEQKSRVLEKFDINKIHEPRGITYLIEACEKEDKSLVSFLLSHGADVNQPTKDNMTALLLTATHSFEISKILIDAGADIDFISPDPRANYTPLCAAAMDGQTETVRYLLEKGADPNLFGEQLHVTPIYAAAQKGYIDIVKLFLAQPNIKVDITSVEQATPVYEAVIRYGLLIGQEKAREAKGKIKNYYTICELLLEKGANPNLQISDLEAPLYALVRMIDKHFNEDVKKIIELLLRYKADINQYNQFLSSNLMHTVLEKAVYQGNDKLVKFLLEKGADPNKPMQSIATMQYQSMSKAGFEDNNNNSNSYSSFNPNSDNNNNNLSNAVALQTLQTQSMDNNNSDAVQTGLSVVSGKQEQSTIGFDKICKLKKEEKKGLVMGVGQTPLHVASVNGNHLIAQALIDKGAAINVMLTVDGYTPLFIACRLGYCELVKVLIRHAKINDTYYKHEDGTTLLHLAAGYGHDNIVRLLILYEHPVNALMKDNTTPLFMAAQEGRTSTVKLLLEQGADPELKKEDGSSPLFMAYKEKHFGVVKVLLENFYKAFFKDKQFETFEAVNDLLLPDGERVIEIKPIFRKTMPVSQAASNLFTATSGAKSPQLVKSDNNYLDYQSPTKEGQSAMAFLMERGFTKDHIAQLQQPAVEEELESDNNNQAAEKISWFGGRLSIDMPEVKSIDPGLTKTPNCFYYFDIQSVTEQGCRDIEVFQNIPLRFAAQKREQGIKDVKGSYNVPVYIGDNIEEFILSDELKSLSVNERILCIRKLSDQGRHTLLIGIAYGDLHDTKGISSIKSKSYTLHFPEAKELEKVESPAPMVKI